MALLGLAGFLQKKDGYTTTILLAAVWCHSGGGHCRRKQVFQLTLKASRVVAASNTLVFFGPYFLFLETSYISCVESAWKKIYLCHRKGLDQSSYVNKVHYKLFLRFGARDLKGSAEMSSIISFTIEIIYVIELAQCWLMTQASIIYFESDYIILTIIFTLYILGSV